MCFYMKKLIIIFTIISIIFSALTGCIFESDDEEKGDDTEPGFSAEELNSPDAGIPQEYLNDFTKPDSTSYGQKVAFRYETTWAFQYNTVYAKLGGVLQRGLQVLDDGLAPLGQLVRGLEPVVDVDVETLRRQVRHVAHRGAHVVVAAEDLRQRLRLGGRFDDDEGFGHQCLSGVRAGPGSVVR